MAETSDAQAGRREPGPPSWMPRESGGLHIEASTLATAVSLGVVVAVTLLLRPPLLLLIPMALALPMAGAGLRWWALRRFEDIESEFTMRMMAQDIEGMLRVYQRARRWSLLVPTHRTVSKLGMIYLARERWKEAERVLEEAWEVTPARLRSRLLGPLATAKFETGAFPDLLKIAQQWRERAPTPGPAAAYLAAAMAETGEGSATEIEALLREAGTNLRPREQRAADLARREVTRMRAAA